MTHLNAAQVEAVATADAHLNNVALPTYTEVTAQLTSAAQSVQSIKDMAELNDRTTEKLLKSVRQAIENGEAVRALSIINTLLA